MNDELFQAGDPLPPKSSCYIARVADSNAYTHLQRMQYITLFEPNHSGKTSLLYRLKENLSGQGYAFAYRNLKLERSRASSTAMWFESLSHQLLTSFDFVKSIEGHSLADSVVNWEQFIDNIAEGAMKSQCRAIIMLDNVDAMPNESWTTEFFSIIRNICDEKATIIAREYISFVIAGAVNPEDLIKDKEISGYNINHKISLDDFTFDEIRKLIIRFNLDDRYTDIITEKVQYWTDGQPYLCQLLCEYLNESRASRKGYNEYELWNSHLKIERAVDKAVERLLQDDLLHLKRVKQVFEDAKLFSSIKRVTQKRTKLHVRTYEHFELAHVYGVIKKDLSGYCKVRNRIYEKELRELEAIFPQNIATPTNAPQTSIPNRLSEKDRLRNHCQSAVVDAYAKAWIFERREEYFRHRVQRISFLGVLPIVIIGTYVSTFGFTNFELLMGTASAISGFVAIVYIWSLLDKWEERHKDALESSDTYRKLCNRFESLTGNSLLNNKQLKSEIDLLEQGFLNINDEITHKQPMIKPKEMQEGRRAALLHYRFPCQECNIIPDPQRRSNCGWCGNYKPSFLERLGVQHHSVEDN